MTKLINTIIVEERMKEYNKVKGDHIEPRVGDFIRIDSKDAEPFYTRITAIHSNGNVQTGGNNGAFHLGGNITYGGRLDAGMKKSDLFPINEKKEGEVWIFDEGIVGAGRRVDLKTTFRVFIPHTGADISGLWDYADYCKKS